MSLVRRLFSSAYRRARRAEALGEYRRAAAHYAEADAPDEAANALLFLAARTHVLDERLAAFHDALRWLPPNHPRHAEVQARIGRATLEEAQRRGVQTSDEKRALLDGAERLELAEQFVDAAAAFELLGRQDDVVRCLQNGGEVEKLEALLNRSQDEAQSERALRRHLRDYEAAVVVGQRREARAALYLALEAAEKDTTVSRDEDAAEIRDLLRRLEQRKLQPHVVTLAASGRTMRFVGRWPIVLGREGDIRMRGTGVSRRHAELRIDAGELIIKDLGSRNGTLLRGVPCAGEVRVSGETQLGLGDHVVARIDGEALAAGRLVVTVEKGLDQGSVGVAGVGALRVPDLSASVDFDSEGTARLLPDSGVEVHLGTQRCATAIELLDGDEVRIAGARIEVSR